MPLKQAVFNDCDYGLLSDDSPISIEAMKKPSIKRDEKTDYYTMTKLAKSLGQIPCLMQGFTREGSECTEKQKSKIQKPH